MGVEAGDEKTLITPKEELKQQFERYKDRVVFHISSRVKENRLDKEAIEAIIAKIDTPMVTFEPQDRSLANSLNAEAVATKSVDELIALLSFAKAVVTLDGGVVHIAPALSKPTVAIFGKTSISRWYPWGYREFCLNVKDEGLASGVEENIKKVLS